MHSPDSTESSLCCGVPPRAELLPKGRQLAVVGILAMEHCQLPSRVASSLPEESSRERDLNNDDAGKGQTPQGLYAVLPSPRCHLLEHHCSSRSWDPSPRPRTVRHIEEDAPPLFTHIATDDVEAQGLPRGGGGGC
uniref:Uncharacterized protein n=1 Tax=Oryza sativa subsp. japonica TaxID=39947 RepID=Q69K65_ORYSJ|nr:hypothetical protein [Oryza sativa Japonica Group]